MICDRVGLSLSVNRAAYAALFRLHQYHLLWRVLAIVMKDALKVDGRDIR